MFTLLFLILGLTVATCVIAYWSDNLGKKLGKKRVTLFGLRPRQTATLITMFSSVLIMLFTLATLLLVNEGLRHALLHYDEERAANTRLRDENTGLRSEQVTLKLQNAKAQTQVATAQKAATVANRQLQTATKTLEYEQKNLKAAKAQEKTARASEKLAQGRAVAAGRRLASTERQLNGVEGNLKNARASLEYLHLQLATAQEDAKQAQQSARLAKSGAVSAKNHYLDETTKYLDETRKQLDKAASLQRQIGGLEQQIATLDKQKTELELAKNQLRTLAFDAQLGEVFAELTILPRLNTSTIAEQVRALLNKGEQTLKVNNPNRTLRLVLPDDSTRLAPSDIIDALVRYLPTFTGPVSLRLTSTRNHAASETEIHAALMPVSARQIFSRNEIITSTIIEAKQSDARVFHQLLTLLNHGEFIARERGVAPLLKGEELFYVADTTERVFETLRRIQAANTTVTVRMIADADISAIDQLRVRFEVVTPEL